MLLCLVFRLNIVYYRAIRSYDRQFEINTYLLTYLLTLLLVWTGLNVVHPVSGVVSDRFHI